MTLNTDTIMLKKLLGEYIFEQKKYPFRGSNERVTRINC